MAKDRARDIRRSVGSHEQVMGALGRAAGWERMQTTSRPSGKRTPAGSLARTDGSNQAPMSREKLASTVTGRVKEGHVKKVPNATEQAASAKHVEHQLREFPST